MKKRMKSFHTLQLYLGTLDNDLATAIVEAIKIPLSEEQKLSLIMPIGTLDQVTNILDKKYTEAFVLAAKYNRLDFIKYVLINFRVRLSVTGASLPSISGTRLDDSVDKKVKPWPALIVASRLGRVEILQHLLDSMEQFTCVDSIAQLLREAVSHGQLETVIYLVENHLKVLCPGFDGLIRLANSYVELEIEEYLLKNIPPETPSLVSTESRNLDVVTFALSKVN